MKKIGIIALTMITLVSCGGEKSLEDLETEKKELISAHKEVVRQQKKELHSLDSILSNHPDFGTQTSKIKTVPVTVDTVKC